MGQGESGAAWGEARRALSGMQRSIRDGDTEEANERLHELDRILEQGAGNAAAWNRIERSLDTIRKLSDLERKWLLELQEMVPRDQIPLLFPGIESVLKDHIPNRSKCADIVRDLIEVYRRQMAQRRGPAA